jgi:hypothetical protein
MHTKAPFANHPVVGLTAMHTKAPFANHPIVGLKFSAVQQDSLQQNNVAINEYQMCRATCHDMCLILIQANG